MQPLTLVTPAKSLIQALTPLRVEKLCYVGALADDGGSGAAVTGTPCDGLAWYATAPAMEFTLAWTAPDCADGTDVTCYATAAENPADMYRQAKVRPCLCFANNIQKTSCLSLQVTIAQRRQMLRPCAFRSIV